MSQKPRRRGKGRKNDPERRLLHEQETRRKREGLLETFMKGSRGQDDTLDKKGAAADKIARESRNVALNTIKLNWQWRTIMRAMKHGDLLTETEVLRESFERAVRIKDRIIAVLANEVDRCDDDHDTIVSSHLSHVDRLLDIQSEHLERLRTSYDTRKSRMVTSMHAELENAATRHQSDLSAVGASLTSTMDAVETSLLTEFEGRRDELLNNSIEAQHAIRSRLNGAMEALWQQYQRLLRSHHEGTDAKRRAFADLKRKDDKNGQEIEGQRAKLQKLAENIARLKRKLETLSNAGAETERRSRTRKDELNAEYQRTVAATESSRRINEERLATLTVSSNDVIHELQTLLNKGKQILKMADLCKKYAAVKGQAHKLVDDRNANRKHLPQAQTDGTPCQSMEAFWKRYSEVSVEKSLLEDELKQLHHENQRLRHLAEDYFEEIATTGDATQHLKPISQRRAPNVISVVRIPVNVPSSDRQPNLPKIKP